MEYLEIFKSDILKKEFDEFVKKTLPEILACNYCNVGFCEMHGRFIATCRKCRTGKCGPCRVFNIQMDSLMRASGEYGKKYIFNFVLDFLNKSSETLKHFCNIDSEKKQKINLSAWKMHEEHGRKNYTSTLSSTMKYQYQMKKRKRFVYFKKGK